MKIIAICAIPMMVLAGSVAQAQNTVYWPAPISAEAQSSMKYFPMGTPVTLIMRTQVSTKDNKPGDRFYLEVAESISHRGQVVLPAGSVAVGEVVRADRNGHFGKKGKLDIRLLYVETPNGPVRLTGRAADEGTSGTITSFATIALVSGLGFLIHGTSAHLPFGTTVTAYLAEDMRFMPNPAMAQAEAVTPERRALPARFDPTVFSSDGPGFSQSVSAR